MEKLQKLTRASFVDSDVGPPKSGTSSNKAIQEGKKQLLWEKLSTNPEIFLFFLSIDRRERQNTRVASLVSAFVQYSFFFWVCTREFILFWEPLTWSRPASACRKCSVLYESASWKLKATVIWARREGWRRSQSSVVTGEWGTWKGKPCAGCSDRHC